MAVLQELLDTDAARQDALARWQAAQPGVAADNVRRDRESEFLRRQAATVAAWQARPAAQRDPRALERELAVLRQTSFDNPQKPTGGTPR
jgi:hypothetical protein